MVVVALIATAWADPCRDTASGVAAAAVERPTEFARRANSFGSAAPPANLGTLPATSPRLQARPDQNRGCVPKWSCRLQLFGVIQKNGGVGLKGTALAW